MSSSNPWSDLPQDGEAPEPAYPLLRRASDQQGETAPSVEVRSLAAYESVAMGGAR